MIKMVNVNTWEIIGHRDIPQWLVLSKPTAKRETRINTWSWYEAIRSVDAKKTYEDGAAQALNQKRGKTRSVFKAAPKPFGVTGRDP